MTAKAFLPGTPGNESQVAVCSPDAEITWAELESRIRRIANGFQALGFQRRDRIAILSTNRLEYVELVLGSLRGGVHAVPVNWHLTVPEVAYILSDSGARALVCDASLVSVGGLAAKQAGVEHVPVIGDGYEDWRDTASDAEPPNVDAGAPMFYTSGTTGRPKGVINRNRETTVADAWPHWRQMATGYGYTTAGRHLLACPAYHAAPLLHIILSMSVGQGVVVMPRFDAEDFLRQVVQHAITSTHVVPTQMARLLALPDCVKQAYDTSSLGLVIHGAAPCPSWVKQQLIDWLGPVMLEYYAFSEGAGQCFATSEEWLARPGTVGRPPPGTEVFIAGDDGNPLPVGETGTIYFRRPGKPPPEYHNAPEKTADSMLPGGWFSVGDVGHQDNDGYVYLADRKVDLIISGGVNIYPAEVESALSEHPDVADCAVFGVPDEEWGEAVKAAVMLEGGVNSDGIDNVLMAWCRERIAGFKCPRSIDFHTEFPRQASGKLLKRELRAPYWEGVERKI
jgi:long-chain acyl-CoA synthetase